ncbi:hypothetical protein [Paracoccus sp. N5]|uniref:hypothetical protein n=1 Tax=Paracoccus sp. N5 TaxID=1101189 RepID=UPI0012FB8B0D|nr:hypothetical protein [Paracoccus sp. N5]
MIEPTSVSRIEVTVSRTICQGGHSKHFRLRNPQQTDPGEPSPAREIAMPKDPGRAIYPANLEDERKEPDGPGRDKPRPSDAPPSSILIGVGKTSKPRRRLHSDLAASSVVAS